MALSIDRVIATTYDNYAPSIADNISEHNPTLYYLRDKNAYKVSGGATLRLPILHAFSKRGAFSGSETLDITKVKGQTAAEYNWKSLYATGVLEHLEILKNSGEEQIIDLLDAETKKTELSLADLLGDTIFGDGTSYSGKAPLGLEAICAVDPSDDNLGGIPSASETWWQNYTNTSVGAQSTQLESALSLALRATQVGNDRVDLCITGNTIYGYLLDKCRSNQRFTVDPYMAERGFQALKFEGVTVLFDAKCPEDRLYGINTKYTKLYVMENDNFNATPWAEPIDGKTKVSKVTWTGQMATSDRKRNFSLSGVTSS